jgi:hypothetical protein
MTLALKNRRKVVQLLTTTGMLRPDQTAGQRRVLARSRGLKVSLIIELLRGSLSPLVTWEPKFSVSYLRLLLPS